MTYEAPAPESPTPDAPPESPSSGPNWMIIGIVAALVVAAILIVFSLLNRGGEEPAVEPTAPPPVTARITIEEPFNGAVLDLAAPIPVRGTAAGLPEGNVVVEALDAAGNVLTTQPTTITASDAGTGGAGPWSVQLTVDVPPGTAGSIRAYSPSPADGSILADVSVAVNFGEAPPPAEASLSISIPHPGEAISAQQAVVVGQGSALPENNVVVQALDAGGNVLAQQPALVEAEVGGRGEWRVTLDYTATPDTPGQIYAFSTSPADGSVLAEASVDIRFGAVAQPAIAIDAPQNGAVVDPAQIAVSGTATALPENNVVVRVLDAGGNVLVEQPTVANAEIGGSGPWSVTLAVDAPAGAAGQIYAFSPSPADGSILAEARVDVQYGGQGQPAIAITAPESGTVVNPAEILVSGTGTALPENNVVVRALDAGGNVLAEQPATVNAELGGSGEWSVTLAVEAGENAPGRIEAFSNSPADGSTVAQAAVDIVYGRPRD